MDWFVIKYLLVRDVFMFYVWEQNDELQKLRDANDSNMSENDRLAQATEDYEIKLRRLEEQLAAECEKNEGLARDNASKTDAIVWRFSGVVLFLCWLRPFLLLLLLLLFSLNALDFRGISLRSLTMKFVRLHLWTMSTRLVLIFDVATVSLGLHYSFEHFKDIEYIHVFVGDSWGQGRWGRYTGGWVGQVQEESGLW